MKQIAVIETVGSITKFEKLSKIENNVLPDTLVLRNLRPFPGYIYEEGNDNGLKLVSIFIMLYYRYSPEKVIKLSSLIKPQLQMECNAGYGEIIMENEIYPCIRIKGLKYISSIPKLQEFIKFQGFKLKKNIPVKTEGIIKVYKTFKLLEIDDDIYRDYYEREKFYLKMPVDINWEMFQSLKNNVKELIHNNNFDAALGEIYRFSGPIKVIRIFDRNKSLERALELKRIFNEELRKEIIYN